MAKTTKKIKVETPVEITETVIDFKKYKVIAPFEMDGQVMNANQAIMLSNTLAKKYEGYIKLI
ncbi:hypothetical protein KA525_03850 [Candidatus Woesebacteria bacterium]|jgi:hypothetical protein|nr:hypothetical protein [Candidatus Woesebacteria bacterium]